MGQYLIDNNVISSYFSDLLPEKAVRFIGDVIDLTPNISVITEIRGIILGQLGQKKRGYC